MIVLTNYFNGVFKIIQNMIENNPKNLIKFRNGTKET